MPGPNDPTNPVPDLSQANDALKEVTNLGQQANDILNGLQNQLQATAISLKNTSVSSAAAALQFGVLTTAIVGAKESFTDFTGVDTSRLDTYTSQVNDLFTMLKMKGTAPEAAKEGMQKLGDTLIGLGVPAAQVKKAMSGTIDTFVSFASNTLKQIDNTQRLQNSFLQLSGQAGNLGDLYSSVGDDLSHLSDVTQAYSNTMTQTMLATHTRSIDVMYQYVSQLNTIPGGFKAITQEVGRAGSSTNLFADIINFATGAQRDQKAVFTDISEAILKYGVNIQDAANFTGRMTEISSKLGIRFEDVHNALLNSEDAFRMFASGPETAAASLQSLSKDMDEFVGRMTGIGIPAQNAISIYKNVTASIANMTEAQGAFLSQQTGGAGGLQGFFALQNKLRAGDEAGVRRQQETGLKQLLGPIVGAKEAEGSQAAAAQYERQIQLIMKGPFGALAKSVPEAMNYLEALKRGVAPKGGPLEKDPMASLNKYAEIGNKIGETHTNILSNIETNTEAMRLNAGNAMLPGIQNMLAQRSTVETGTGRGVNLAARTTLNAAERAGTHIGAGGAVDALKNAGDTLSSLPRDLRGALAAFQQSLKSENQEKLEIATRHLNESIKNAKATATTPEAKRTIDSLQEQVHRAVSHAVGPAAIARPGGGPAAPLAARPGGPIPVTLTGDNKLNVTINSTCPHCGNKSDHSAYASVANPAHR